MRSTGRARAGATLAVALSLAGCGALAGCGVATGLDAASSAVGPGGTLGPGGGAGGGGLGTLSPTACQPQGRWTLYAGADDAYGAVAVTGDAGVGLLFWSDAKVGPRDLRFTKLDLFAPQPIASWLTLTSTPAITQAGLAAFGGGFYAAWVDEAFRVHVGRLGTGGLESDVLVGGAPGLVATTLGTTGGGRLVVAWTEPQGATAALRVATSADGLTFDAGATLTTRGTPSALSLAPAPAGAAVTWSEGFQDPDHSELHFALVGEGAAPVVSDAALTHHDRYVYDTRVARAGGRFVIATTDSRADLGSVPLYSTSVSLAGAPTGVDTRLTYAGVHEHLDATFDGASVGLGYDEYDPGGSQIFLRQIDATGADLFGPLQVSLATFQEDGCCTDTRSTTLAADGEGRILVLWSESEARSAGATAFSLKAALLDCATRD